MTSTTSKSRVAARATKKQPEVRIVLTHDQIARHAYHIWERRGRPHGQAMQHWLEAEADLRRVVALGHEPV